MAIILSIVFDRYKSMVLILQVNVKSNFILQQFVFMIMIRIYTVILEETLGISCGIKVCVVKLK